jgi:hypothetical protein
VSTPVVLENGAIYALNASLTSNDTPQTVARSLAGDLLDLKRRILRALAPDA